MCMECEPTESSGIQRNPICDTIQEIQNKPFLQLNEYLMLFRFELVALFIKYSKKDVLAVFFKI